MRAARALLALCWLGQVFGGCAPTSCPGPDRPPDRILLVTTIGCAPCSRAIARLSRASRAAARPALVEVVVLADEPADVDAYCAGVPAPFTCGGDRAGQIARSLAVRELPVMVWQRLGSATRRADGADVEEEIERALAGW